MDTNCIVFDRGNEAGSLSFLAGVSKRVLRPVEYLSQKARICPRKIQYPDGNDQKSRPARP